MRIELKIAIDRYVGFCLIFWLNFLARFLGVTLRRDHSLKVRGDILVIKMLGGGSLVMALPALLGIRRAFPDRRLRLFTTCEVKPFAETLGVFDEIVTLDDRSLRGLVESGLRCLRSCFGCDTVIDLEVYSYLSAVFGLLTFARNRLGFFFDEQGFRQRLHTHRVFFNPGSPLYLLYDRMADLLDAPVALMQDCAAHVRGVLGIGHTESSPSVRRIAVGCGCSNFSMQVRKLSPQQWSRHVFAACPDKNAEIVFLGSADDYEDAENIIATVKALGDSGWGGRLINLCGTMALKDSLRALAECDAFWGIDSSLLHYARLFGLRVKSFFGPADPATRLRPIEGLDEQIHYRRTLCSPCIHQVSIPPCGGNNLCMQWLFDEEGRDDPRARWIPAMVDTRYTEKERL